MGMILALAFVLRISNNHRVRIVLFFFHTMDLHLSYPDGTQKTLSLTDLCKQSPFTILYFYPKDDTPWCSIQAQDFSRLFNDFHDLGIQIVWVSKDPHKSHCKFMDKYAIPYPLISDPDFALHEQFGTVGLKSMYGKQYLGTIRSTVILNTQGEIITRWDDVSPSWHAEMVLAYRKSTYH